MKKTINWITETGLHLIALCAIAVFIGSIIAGCRAVTVRNYGEEVAKDAEGKPVTLADGRIQTIKKGWKVHHNQHWMVTTADSINATVKPEEITFAMNGLNSQPSEELNKLVDTSLKGAAELAAKVGAAIASSGGSVAGDAAYSALKSAIAKYVTKGGDVEKAEITCKDGSCTISDGTVTETCTDCVYSGN